MQGKYHEHIALKNMENRKLDGRPKKQWRFSFSLVFSIELMTILKC